MNQICTNEDSHNALSRDLYVSWQKKFGTITLHNINYTVVT